MIEHDETVGSLLNCLDDLAIGYNTVVVYSTDNGPHMNTWARRSDDVLSL